MDDITAYLITTYNADTVIIEGEDGPFKVKGEGDVPWQIVDEPSQQEIDNYKAALEATP